MPRIKEPRAQGQSVRYQLTMAGLTRSLTTATVKRIYWERKDTATGEVLSGYFEAGVTSVGDNVLQFDHHDLPKGQVALTPHAEWADGWVSRSPDPAIFTVTALGKKP